MEQIRLIAGHVWRSLGPGFSERVYHNAMEVSLRRAGIPYQTERIVPIIFDDHAIGNIRADLIVNSQILVELKSVRALKDEHRVQGRMYMRILGLPNGMLINFPVCENELQCEQL